MCHLNQENLILSCLNIIILCAVSKNYALLLLLLCSFLSVMFTLWIDLSLGADLANLVNAAAIYAATEGDQSVTTKHLEFSRDKILMGKRFTRTCDV